MAPAKNGGENPIPIPVTIKAIPTVAIDVKEVPVETATIAVTKQAAGTKNPGDISFNP